MTQKHQLILKLALLGACWAVIGTLRADQQNCAVLCPSKKCINLQQCITHFEEPEYKDTPNALKQCGLCFPGAPILMIGNVSKSQLNLYSSQLKTIYLKVFKELGAVSQSFPTAQVTLFLANQQEYQALQGKKPTTLNIDALYKKDGALYNPQKPHNTRYKIRRASIDAASEPIELISTPNLGDETVAIGLQVTVQMPYFSLSQQKGGSLVPEVVQAWWLPKGGSCIIQVPTNDGKGQLKRLQCKMMDNRS